MSRTSSGDVYYFLDETTGLMVFYGEGVMEEYGTGSYGNSQDYSWYSKGSTIKNVVYEKGIIRIREWSFNNKDYHETNYLNLKNVNVGKTVTYIEEGAFYCCFLTFFCYHGKSEPSYERDVLTTTDYLSIVYVPTDYTGSTTTFCGKSVTVKKVL